MKSLEDLMVSRTQAQIPLTANFLSNKLFYYGSNGVSNRSR